jgi:hypothetical protein
MKTRKDELCQDNKVKIVIIGKDRNINKPTGKRLALKTGAVVAGTVEQRMQMVMVE